MLAGDAKKQKVSSTNRLVRWIALSMVMGVLVGYLCHVFVPVERNAAVAGYFTLVTDSFLSLIKMVVAPLVFASIVSGMSSMDDSSTIARIGTKAMVWFVGASFLSLAIGLIFVGLLEPGKSAGLQPPPGVSLDQLSIQSLNVGAFVKSIFPSNIVQAMANNAILQILVFSIFFGVALNGLVASRARRFLKEAVDDLLEVMLRITNAVMLLAPLGIFASLAAIVSSEGLGVLITYGKLIGTFYVALFALWVALIVAGAVVLRERLTEVLRAVREPMMIAFSTASSEAAYPKLIDRLSGLGISKPLVGFVLPMGYTFNLDGSMVYQAFAVMFIAQAFGIDMSVGQQVTIMLVLMLSSKGMAAVPRGALVVVAALLPMFGLPEAGILLVMAVDQFLDMGRTATNVLGNSIATAVVARWENEWPSRNEIELQVSVSGADTPLGEKEPAAPAVMLKT